MTTPHVFTEPAGTDAKAICDRLDAIHAQLERLSARQGTQGLGWSGGPTGEEPPQL